jgi:K+-transporting ATPase ATPase A chain
MSPEFVYVALLLGVLLVLAVPTGRYIAKVFSGERTPLTPLLRPIEKRLMRTRRCLGRHMHQRS